MAPPICPAKHNNYSALVSILYFIFCYLIGLFLIFFNDWIHIFSNFHFYEILKALITQAPINLKLTKSFIRYLGKAWAVCCSSRLVERLSEGGAGEIKLLFFQQLNLLLQIEEKPGLCQASPLQLRWRGAGGEVYNNLLIPFPFIRTPEFNLNFNAQSSSWIKFLLLPFCFVA